MHYVDLHYKGVKIRRSWRHLLLKSFFATFLLISVTVFVWIAFRQRWNFKLVDFSQGQDMGEWKEVLFCLGLTACAGLIGTLILAVVLYRLFDYIKNLERMCEMIYTHPFYLVNNIEYPELVSMESSQKVKREIMYFASFWYKVNRGMVEITVMLDGSKFHVNGDYENMNDVLESTFCMNVIDMQYRKNYLTYKMIGNVEAARFKMQDIVPVGYTIPLMRGVVWDIAKIPHALVNGATGGGKSFFLNVLIRAFIHMGADIRICDFKNSALADYASIIPKTATTKDGIMQIVAECVSIMNQWYRDIKGHTDYISGQDFTHYGIPPVVLILDEYVAFADTLVKKEKDEFKANLNQIVLKGREAGVFVILATQRPDAEFVSGNVRDQLGLRVTLGRMSKDGYRMAFGITEQKLKNKGGRGRGYIYMDGYTFIQEFYAPLVPNGYRFIDEARKLLALKPCAYVPSGTEASKDFGGQESGGAAYRKAEIIYEQEGN